MVDGGVPGKIWLQSVPARCVFLNEWCPGLAKSVRELLGILSRKVLRQSALIQSESCGAQIPVHHGLARYCVACLGYEVFL